MSDVWPNSNSCILQYVTAAQVLCLSSAVSVKPSAFIIFCSVALQLHPRSAGRITICNASVKTYGVSSRNPLIIDENVLSLMISDFYSVALKYFPIHSFCVNKPMCASVVRHTAADNNFEDLSNTWSSSGRRRRHVNIHGNKRETFLILIQAAVVLK